MATSESTHRRNVSGGEKMGVNLWSFRQIWCEASRRGLQTGRTDDTAAGP